MSKRWRSKTNSSNILLVLITLILIKAEWVMGTNATSLEIIKSIEDWQLAGQTQLYIGNDEIARHYFQPSTNNSSLILDGVRKCLDSFQLMTCIKLLLLDRINEVVEYVEEPNMVEKDLNFLHGLMIFKKKNETSHLGFSETNDVLSLDEEIAFKVLRIFRNRFLLINLLPKFKIEVEPNHEAGGADIICFNYKIQREPQSEDKTDDHVTEGRGKKKGGGMGMMMLVPQMIMLGLMPFTLASLKAMVMNAVMINMMALNGAIFMTIRNLVFGPRRGDNVKYVNYGYSKDRQTQSKKPVLIIHSPAAFVKQPSVYPKYGNLKPAQFHKAPNHEVESYFPSGDSSLSHHHQHYVKSEDNDYYLIQQDFMGDGSNNEHHNRRLTQRKEQGNALDSFNSAGTLNTRETIMYNFKNTLPSVPYQRKLATLGIKTRKDVHEKYSFEPSPGLASPNLARKKAGGHYDHSRQTEESSRLF